MKNKVLIKYWYDELGAWVKEDGNYLYSNMGYISEDLWNKYEEAFKQLINVMNEIDNELIPFKGSEKW